MPGSLFLPTSGGAGDVVGPASSVDNAIARMDGTTGKLLQGYTSGAPTVSDTGAVSIATTLTIPVTTGAAVGVIERAGVRFLHTYFDPTSDGQNMFLGDESGNFTMGPGGGASLLGAANTGVGYQALKSMTTGYKNIAIGANALKLTTTGLANVAIGAAAMADNTTGSDNVAIGEGALAGNTTGRWNNAVGEGTLSANTIGNRNVGDGFSALFVNTEGDDNVAIGYQALKSNTTAVRNVGIGTDTLLNSVTGEGNVGLGFNAGYYSVGNYNTFLGYAAAVTVGTNGSNNTVVGNGALLTGATTSNEVVLGNASVTNFRVPGVGMSVSTTAAVVPGLNVDTAKANFTGNKLGIGQAAPDVNLAIGSVLLTSQGLTGAVLNLGGSTSQLPGINIGQDSTHAMCLYWVGNATPNNAVAHWESSGYLNDFFIDGKTLKLQTGSHGAITVGSHLLFTDNTYDIGASAATRPRTLYLGTSLVFSAGNIVTDTTTGTKIATATTQKLGLWNVTPIIQPAAAGQAAFTDSSGGTPAASLVDVTSIGASDPAKVNANFATISVLLLAMRTAMVNFGSMKGAS